MSENVIPGPAQWVANARRSLTDEVPDSKEGESDKLDGGGGPPHDPGMEARMSAVEADTREIKGILQRLEPVLGRVDDRLRKLEADTLPKISADLARLEGRVSQLPGTVTIIGFVLAVLAAGGVLKYLYG